MCGEVGEEWGFSLEVRSRQVGYPKGRNVEFQQFRQREYNNNIMKVDHLSLKRWRNNNNVGVGRPNLHTSIKSKQL